MTTAPHPIDPAIRSLRLSDRHRHDQLVAELDLLHHEALPIAIKPPAEARVPDDEFARRLTDPQGGEVVLTTGEFDLLAVFVRHAGRVLSRDFLLEQTRGRDAGPFDRTIDVQVGRLRRKMEADSDRPELIKSVRGAGYVLVPEVAAE